MKRRYLTETQLYAMQKAVDENVEFQTARKIAVEIGLTDDAGVPLDVWAKPADFNITFAFRWVMYNPADTGRNGKATEVGDRIDWAKAKGRALPWAEFSAHKQGKLDNRFSRIDFERKTGTGHWFNTATLEQAVTETTAHRRWIWFSYETDDVAIEIITTYDKWWKILASYNPRKGIATWFKWNPTRKEWDFQTLKTSTKKLHWLESHNCDDRP